MAQDINRKKSEICFLLSLCALTFILLIFISYNFSPLFTGPEEWNWKYFPLKTYSKLWFAISLFLILILFISYLFSNYQKNISRGKEFLSLIGLVLLGYFFFLSIAFLYKEGILFLSQRISEESSTSFFNVAVNFHNKIGFLLSSYAKLMPQFPIHAQTHPPGPIIFFWGINKFFEEISSLTNPLYCVLISGHPFLLRLYEAQGLGAIFSSLFIPFLGCLTVFPIYYLGKNIYNQQVAILSSSIYIFIPAIALMSPFLDLSYPLLITTIIYFFLAGLKANKLYYSLISGIFFALGLFFTFKILMALLLLVTMMGIFLFKEKILSPQLLKELRERDVRRILFSLFFLLPFPIGYFFGIKKLTVLLIIELIFLVILYQEENGCIHEKPFPSNINYFSSYGFSAKFLLIFPIATIILFLTLYIVYGFNIFEVYYISKRLHEQATLRNRTYSTWLFFNLYDFFLFMGIPLSVILFKRFFLEVKMLKNMDFFLASFLFTIFLLNFSGRVLGEVSRIWLPLMPFALYPVSKELLSNNWHRFVQIIFILILLFLQIIIFREFIQVP